MNIAVDAMGGDNAPKVVVQGAIKASDELGINIILVGDSESISVELEGKEKKRAHQPVPLPGGRADG